MSENQRTFDAEVWLAQTPKKLPESKPEETASKQKGPRKNGDRRTFSRETVMRLIDWFKHD
jgi:hypothetical protein